MNHHIDAHTRTLKKWGSAEYSAEQDKFLSMLMYQNQKNISLRNALHRISSMVFKSFDKAVLTFKNPK